MRRFALLCVVLLLLAGIAHADPDTSLEARAKILSAEMRRNSTDLVPYLQPDADPQLRRLAIRALGRIGNDGNAPGILRDMLATETKDLGLLLWAAGIAMSKELGEPLTDKLAALLEAGDVANAAIAARSLGWTGAEGAGTTLSHLLGSRHAPVRAAALVGLGRARMADRAVLDAASKLIIDADENVREAAEFGCWLMAGAYARKAKAADEAWDGESEIAKRFLGLLLRHVPDCRLAGVRVLGILLPKSCSSDGPFGAVFELRHDVDDRVVQEAISRIFAGRTGAAVDAALASCLVRKDPKTRAAAAQALGQHDSPESLTALRARWDIEPDARVRETLAVWLARRGHEACWKQLQAGGRAKDPVVREATDAQVLLLSKRPEAIVELFRWADPGASQRADLHAGTWMTVLSGIGDKEGEVPGLDTWLMGFLDGGYAIERDERPYVIGTAVGVVGSKKRHALAGTLLEMLGRSWSGPPHDEIHQSKLHFEIRAALMGAFADLAADEGCKAETAVAMKSAIRRHMIDDPSPWVRLAARKAATALKFPDVPEIDTKQPTDWRGVPRAANPTPGIDPAGDSEYLDEKQILQMADWIRDNTPVIVFETTAGRFTVTLDAEAAPVHSVSLFNAVRNGVYDGTRWHRVVPSFVIQGGDPHGHGAGSGGWHVPDEITTKPYVRGALGMPKSVKDDGGCQLFFMHSAYHPLDERYTCYGDVVDGMQTVDKIRVGDFIEQAYVLVRLR